MKFVRSVATMTGVMLLAAVGLLFAYSPASVSAAGAQCFTSQQNVIADCQKVDIDNLKALQDISSLPDNACYLMTYAANADFGSMPTITTATVGDSSCNSWQSQAHQTTSTPASCFNITGANINVGTWNQDAVPGDSIHKATCSDSLIKAQPSSSRITSFGAGQCYIIFSDHSIYSVSCTRVIQEIAAANGSQTKAQDSSNKTENAVPAGKPSESLGPSDTEKQIQNDCKDNSTAGLQNCIQKNPLIEDINNTITLLSGAIGVIVLIMIIIGGMQYMSAGGNAQKVAAAKGRITNAVLSLLALVFLYAFLQWVIPGGPF